MQPSETICGQAWLSNFHATDVDTATLLINSLRVLSLSELRIKLLRLLGDATDEGSIPCPALVVPERGLGRLGVDKGDRDTAVAWRDFLPGAPLSVTPGSDGFVGMVLRDFAPAGRSRATAGGRLISPDANVEVLRAARCRSIVILTDFVGTGAQAEALAGAISRNKTIRSWRSLHLVGVHVAAVAAQRSGVDRLTASRHVDAVHAIEAAPAIWTSIADHDVQDAVVDLCRTYSRKKHRLALGYGNSAGLFVTERGAPNNLPAVFTQEASEWRPLFGGRTVPGSFMRELGEYRPSEDLEALAKRVGQSRLGGNERLQSIRRSSRDLLQVLTSASTSTTDASSLAESMGIDVEEADAYLGVLRGWGFVNGAGRITEEGRRELAEYKRGRRRTTAHLQGSSDSYYPLGLR